MIQTATSSTRGCTQAAGGGTKSQTCCSLAMAHAKGLKKVLSCPLTGGCFGVNALDGYTTLLLLLTFHNKMRQQPKPWSDTKMLQNTKACLLSPSSSSTRYDQMSASSSTWTQTEKVGPEFQEVPVWKIRWVSTSFKQIQNQSNFPVKLLVVPPQDFFPPLI